MIVRERHIIPVATICAEVDGVRGIWGCRPVFEHWVLAAPGLGLRMVDHDLRRTSRSRCWVAAEMRLARADVNGERQVVSRK